jgi:hypothetical protein
METIPYSEKLDIVLQIFKLTAFHGFLDGNFSFKSICKLVHSDPLIEETLLLKYPYYAHIQNMKRLVSLHQIEEIDIDNPNSKSDYIYVSLMSKVFRKESLPEIVNDLLEEDSPNGGLIYLLVNSFIISNSSTHELLKINSIMNIAIKQNRYSLMYWCLRNPYFLIKVNISIYGIPFIVNFWKNHSKDMFNYLLSSQSNIDLMPLFKYAIKINNMTLAIQCLEWYLNKETTNYDVKLDFNEDKNLLNYVSEIYSEEDQESILFSWLTFLINDCKYSIFNGWVDAVLKADFKLMNFLLQNGMDINDLYTNPLFNKKQIRKENYLFIAISNKELREENYEKYLEVVNFLLQNGIDLKSKLFLLQLEYFYDSSAYIKDKEIVNLLKKFGVEFKFLDY